MISFSNCSVTKFHQEVCNTFSPLPLQNKALEIIKRIAIAALTPFAYLILGVISPFEALIGRASLTKNDTQDIYFARYINVQSKNPGISDLKAAITVDLDDSKKGYQKGACLYTPNSIQPLAAFDPRHEAGTQIGVDYPFALLIDPQVKLHYWSLQDMDRNMHREKHENKQKENLKKYKPEGCCHTIFPKWKTIHFTPINEFINKIECVAKAAKTNGKYQTAGGKQKSIRYLKKNHNEGSISYNPEKDVKGILIKNAPENIKLTREFQKNYKDDKGNQVFKNVFLAYQDNNGRIVKIK